MKGIERIKVLSSEIENKATLKVINYLLSRNDMNDKYLNEEKSLKQMIEYIRSEVQKDAKDGMAFVEDEYVYNLAIHYFDESNEKLGLKNEDSKKEKEKVEKSKPVLKSLEQSCKEVEEMEKEEATEKNKEEITLRVTKNKFLPEGQLSLF